MNRCFQELISIAEQIRAQCRLSGNVGPHAAVMAEMVKYGQTRSLLTGNPLDGTASEEYLAQAVEMAAMVVESATHKSLGAVHSRTSGEKMELIRLAKDMAELEIFSIE